MESWRNELYHYGRLGQKWGVRNGPPYPIDHTVLRKGTKLNSVSGDPFGLTADTKRYLLRKQKEWLYTYNPEDSWDSAVYKGPFSQYLALGRGAKFVREHEFEVVKDLKMPTKAERIAEFKNLLSDKKYRKIAQKEIENIRKRFLAANKNVEPDPNSEEYKIIQAYKNFNVKKIDDDIETAYSLFGHAMENIRTSKTATEYSKRMSEKYDAMVDDNNQGVYNNAHDPVIIFKANEMLKDISDPNSPKFLTMKEILDNSDYVRNELAKTGRRVML